MKRLVSALFFCGLLAIGGAWASSPGANTQAAPVTLQFWHSMTGEKSALLQKLVDGFNEQAENRGKTAVELQFIGSYEEGLNKLRTALIAGRGPHVVQITDIGTQVMIDSDSIVPLQDFIDRDPTFPLAQILPPIRRYYEVNGKLYSLPFATSNPILYYNVDAFKRAGIGKPPRTYAELEADCRKLTDAKARTAGITWPLNSWIYEEFMGQNGALLVEPENGRGARASRADYLSAESIAFVEFWARLAREGLLANVGRGWDPAEQNFLAGRAAMLITSTSDIFENLAQAPFRLGTAPIPSRGEAHGEARGGTIIGGNSLWILKNKAASEQQAAYRFLKYMASAPVQETWHTHTGYFPIRADVIETLRKRGFYAKFPVAWVALEQMRHSPDSPATRGALMGVFPEAREHLSTAIEEVLAGHATAENALKRAKEKTDFSLLRYNRGKK